jgi:hypothetical protein
MKNPIQIVINLLAFACLGLISSPSAFGVNPPPDGGYPSFNTAEGQDALFSLNTDFFFSNTAVGYKALFSTAISSNNTAVGRSSLFANDAGFSNTAVGELALRLNTSGAHNTGISDIALAKNTTGDRNTAVGRRALSRNREGNDNTATGWAALSYATGTNNTATGANSLEFNITGNDNTGTGIRTLRALYSNSNASSNTATGADSLRDSRGNFNTASGAQALENNTTGASNTAVGYTALVSNTTGASNTAVGLTALGFNTSGDHNTATGTSALLSNTTGAENTAIGYLSLFRNTSGSNNIALGNLAGSNLTTGSNNIAIGNEGAEEDPGLIRIGTAGSQLASFVAGITEVPISGGVPVGVSGTAQLGVKPSSKRFKEAIRPMESESEAIFALKPVTFRYKEELGSDGAPQFGLVAEQVEQVNPDLVVHDHEGKPFSVRYGAVNAMLLNEFVSAHRQLEEFASIIAQQEAQIRALTKNLREQAAQLKKVGDSIAIKTGFALAASD